MKRTIFAALLVAASCFLIPDPCFAVNRNITESWDIGRTPRTPLEIYFLQAESIQFDLSIFENGAPYALTNENLVVVWELSAGANYTNLMAVGTGTVVSATGGVVRLTLTPEQSNLPVGTYNGYVIAAVSDGTNLTDRVVLARQAIAVSWSPYGLEFEYVELISPFYTRTQTDDLLAPIFASTSSWHTAYGWGDHALAGYASTGTVAALSSIVTTATGNVAQAQADITALESGTNNWNTAYGWGNHAGLYPAIADFQTLESNAVTSIILNSITNTPVAGVVDLGTIGGDPTNVLVYTPNSVSVWTVKTNALVDSFIAYDAGRTNINGLYTQLSSVLYTNVSTGTYMDYGIYGATTWAMYEGDYDYYTLNSTSTTPWLVSGWVESWDGSTYLPVPSFSVESIETNQVANLTNSLQWVSAPTGSVSTGTSGQYSISADTNQLFYWFSPSAISGSTTGVWLRVLGETF